MGIPSHYSTSVAVCMTDNSNYIDLAATTPIALHGLTAMKRIHQLHSSWLKKTMLCCSYGGGDSASSII